MQKKATREKKLNEFRFKKGQKKIALNYGAERVPSTNEMN